MYNALKFLHIFSIILWIGGMIFAHFFLRPSLALLEPNQRVLLMHATLKRFFGTVLVVSVLAWASGMSMMALSGGGSMPKDWMVMAALGTLMLGIFFHIRLVLFVKMSERVERNDLPGAGEHLNKIRQWVLVNLIIGVVITATALLL